MGGIGFIVTSIVVAAVIGGVTNHLAIKMLFHPRRAIKLGNVKLPFTPGIIPKRKDEIARSLGQVVSRYLVTSDGLKQLFMSSAFEQRIISLVDRRLETFMQERGTIRSWIMERYGDEKLAQLKHKWTAAWLDISKLSVRWLWEERKLKERTLAEVIPDWSDEMKEKTVQKMSNWLLDTLAAELQSENGKRMILNLTVQFMDQAGGWLGALAGAFVDEQKLSAKIRHIALAQLETTRVRNAVEGIVRTKMSELEQYTLEQVIDQLTESEQESEQFFIKLLHNENSLMLFDHILDTPIASLDQPISWFRQRLPNLVQRILKIVVQRLDGLVRSLELDKLVEQQVNQFPIDQLERILLRISGKEFRAITWLGAVIGGLIGLFQALLLRWYM